MRIGVQWALSTPRDWVDIDASEWAGLPKKPEPAPNFERVDRRPGHVFDVCIQGVHLYGFDHYAIEPLDDGVRASVWNSDVDDPDPQVDDYRWGEVWEFYPPGFDERVGQVNTRQRKTIYTEAEPERFTGQVSSCGAVDVRPWSEFPEPDPTIVRHGVWVRDEARWQRHFEVRAKRGWREWI